MSNLTLPCTFKITDYLKHIHKILSMLKNHDLKTYWGNEGKAPHMSSVLNTHILFGTACLHSRERRWLIRFTLLLFTARERDPGQVGKKMGWFQSQSGFHGKKKTNQKMYASHNNSDAFAKIWALQFAQDSPRTYAVSSGFPFEGSPTQVTRPEIHLSPHVRCPLLLSYVYQNWNVSINFK
jgi:hypothetical protein